MLYAALSPGGSATTQEPDPSDFFDKTLHDLKRNFVLAVLPV